MKDELVRNVLEVKRVSVMSLKLETGGVIFNTVSCYAPQVGNELEERAKFGSDVNKVMQCPQ